MGSSTHAACVSVYAIHLSCGERAHDPNTGKYPSEAFGLALTRDAGPKPRGLSHGVFSASPRKTRAGPTS